MRWENSTVSVIQEASGGLTADALRDTYYLMFDVSSSYTMPCSSTTACPIISTDCNPPYDFYPK